MFKIPLSMNKLKNRYFLWSLIIFTIIIVSFFVLNLYIYNSSFAKLEKMPKGLIDLNINLLLLKHNFFPDKSLNKTTDQEIPKIDMHEHYFYNGEIDTFLKAAQSLGISRTVFLGTGLKPDNRGYKVNQRYLLKYWKKIYPGKIVVFCTIDEADPGASRDFEECLKDGGEGLKILGGHPDYYDEPLDSSNMFEVYKVAQKYDVPVIIHASILKISELKTQTDNILSSFPDVKFIMAHYCSAIYNGIKVEECAYFLDKYPNAYVDMTSGHGFSSFQKGIKSDMQKLKDFTYKYQDRLVFGADTIVGQNKKQKFKYFYDRINCEIRLLEEKSFKCRFGLKGEQEGLNLNPGILDKIYYQNPKRLLKI